MAKDKDIKEVDSPEKLKRLAVVEAYKTQNPAKYELKKAELDKWVNAA
jgi:hypothetical protein